MLVINQDEIDSLLSMESCIEVMKTVLAEFSKGEAVQELRSVMPVKQGKLLGIMPGVLKQEKVVGTKVITVYDGNHNNGLPSHQGVVLLFDADNGKLKATIDATKITGVRTAAVSAVATDYLAKKDSRTLGMVGSGEQARTHLEAMLKVRPIEQVKVWSRNREHAESFKVEMEPKFQIPVEIYDSVREVAADADIICTVTSSKEPVLKGEWVQPGTHVNAVGACQPKDRELDSDLAGMSDFYVDRLESAIHESGDYLIPLAEGIIEKAHIKGEIGELLTGAKEGRKSDSAVTVFESLGLAVEDLATAQFIYQEAVRLHKGTQTSI
ncbi:MAG TPA: ornithine cyclodeaminase family protein [Bacillales bacterium]|nr:ornithine cyclodeaminase family protein [Bacillales bacterium]